MCGQRVNEVVVIEDKKLNNVIFMINQLSSAKRGKGLKQRLFQIGCCGIIPAILLASSTVLEAAPVAPKLVTPINEALLTNPGMIQFTWNSLINARRYEIRFRTHQSPTGAIDARYETKTPGFSIILHPNCVWEWSVRAFDGRSWGPATKRLLFTWDGTGCPPYIPDCTPVTEPPFGPGTPPPPPKSVNNKAPVLTSIVGHPAVAGFQTALGRYTVSLRADDRLPRAATIRWKVCQLSKVEISRGEVNLPNPICTQLTTIGPVASITFRETGAYEVIAVADDGQLASAPVRFRVRALVTGSISTR